MLPSALLAWRNIDYYPLLRPLLFQLDAETAHHFALFVLKMGLGPKIDADFGPSLKTELCGIKFENPIGLAAGFDKQIEVIEGILGFGFGFTEVGSITPLPQIGNPKPRLFRVPNRKAIINRFGFNSDGFETCLQRIKAYRQQHAVKAASKPPIVGINIGKNKDTLDATTDYVLGVQKFAPYATYMTINVSSPNTPGLRDLQGREQMAALLKNTLRSRDASAEKPPIFIKIAPDLDDAQQDDIAEVVLSSGIDGMIIGNTTITRPSDIPQHLAEEKGGLSGEPLFEMSTLLLSKMYKKTGGKIPLIGCGGIKSAEDVYTKIRAGASLVQVYSALIYAGPFLISKLNRDLAALLARDGFKNLKEVVGINHR